MNIYSSLLVGAETLTGVFEMLDADAPAISEILCLREGYTWRQSKLLLRSEQ